LLLSSCFFGSETEGVSGSETEGIYGFLVLPDNRAATGATVTLSKSEDSSLARINRLHTETKTDSTGKYHFPTVTPGTYNIVTSYVDNGSQQIFVSVIHDITFVDAVVKVDTSVMVKPGSILLKIDTPPLEGVDCWIPNTTPKFTSDEIGRCYILNIPPGTYPVYYNYTGFLTNKDSGKVVVENDTTEVKAHILTANPVLRPPTPVNLWAESQQESGTIKLTWASVNVSDLDGYIIFRDDTSSAASTPLNLSVLIKDNQFIDTIFTDMADTVSRAFKYRVKAQDKNGDKSDFSGPVIAVVYSPDKPAIPEPVNGADSLTLFPELSWAAVSGSGGKLITYDVLLDTTKSLTRIISNGQSQTSLKTSNLKEYAVYYWQIIAHSGNEVIKGPVWSFTTKEFPVVNKPPAEPSSPRPINNSVDTDTSFTLYWSSGDSNGGKVTYSIYLGTSSTPTKIGTQDNDTNIQVTGLKEGVVYYWRVDAKDSNTSTRGPIWKFTTKNFSDNLVAHWNFDSSSTTLYDQSGNGNNGVISEAVFSANSGVDGKGSLYFNGSNSQVTIPSSPQFDATGGITIMAWIKSISSTMGAVISNFSPSGMPFSGWEVMIGGPLTADRLYLYLGEAAGSQDWYSVVNSGWADNKWHHVTVILDGMTIKFYKDGVLSGSVQKLGVLNGKSTNVMYIGRDCNLSRDRNFTGSIDQVKIYSSPLSDFEVKQEFDRFGTP